MEIKILNQTQDDITLISICARTCYNSISKMLLTDEEIKTCNGRGEIVNLSKQKKIKFIKSLIKSGHETPLENAVITFSIKNVSRALLAQITRHRLATFCVESQRYVKYDKEEYKISEDYYVPDSIKNNPDILTKYEKHHQQCCELYNSLIKNNIPAEDARFILPQSFFTNLTMTMNYREIRHFLKLRLNSHAQAEIRTLAQEIKKLIPEWLTEDII